MPEVPASPPRRGRDRSRPAAVGMVLLLLLVPLWVGLVVYTSPVFRGSDQTWYVEDVTTIMAGRPAQTHEVYPFSLLGADRRFDASRPFVHDIPVLWVWAGAARAVGGDAHAGILLVNILSSLGAAAFVFLAARRFVPRVGALAAAVAMLYVPVFFWITSQDLAEPFSALLVAASVWLAVRWPRSVAAWAGAAGLAAFAAVGRIWTLPLIVLLPIGLLVVDDSSPWPRRIVKASAVLAAGLVVYVPLSRIFVSYAPPFDLTGLVDVSSATNNMVLYLTPANPQPFDLGALARGIAHNIPGALQAQSSFGPGRFTVTRSLPAADQWPVNLMALLAASGLFVPKTDRLRRFVMALAVLAFGMHLSAAILLQNVPRYLVPLLPLIILGAAVATGLWIGLARARARRWATYAATAAVCVALASFIAIDVANAAYYRADAFGAQRRRQAVSGLLAAQAVPTNARVALDTRFGQRWSADWAIYPRAELALGTDVAIPAQRYMDLVALFHPEYIVTDGTSRLPAILAQARQGKAERLGSAGGYTLWRLSPAGP